MTITLKHHPHTRASTVVWMLEEAGCEYELEFIDIQSGAQKGDALRPVNPMGKVPTLIDEGVVVTEAAAIALYLGDRYALGRLAPEPSDPKRGPYLRWSFYAPSVIEPGCMAKASDWAFKPGSAGWGSYPEMLDTISTAIGEGPWLLGESFSMADIVFGGTIRWMTMFGMLEKRPEYMAYVERLDQRPAARKANEVNQAVAAERGLA